MADGTIAIDEPTSIDKRLDTTQLTVSATTVQRERVVIAGAADVDLAPVDATLGLTVDPADRALRDLGKVDIAGFDASLPAGTNAIGKLAANSGVDIGDVDVLSSALPTGASTLAEQQTQTTALQLIDDAIFTDDNTFTPATSKVMVIGAQADDTSPDSVNEGDAGALRMSLARALHTVCVADTATLTNVADAATSAQLLAANANRVGCVIHNDSTQDLYLKYGTTASATDYTVRIPAGLHWTMPFPAYTGRLDGIWAANASGSARITELT